MQGELRMEWSSRWRTAGIQAGVRDPNPKQLELGEEGGHSSSSQQRLSRVTFVTIRSKPR